MILLQDRVEGREENSEKYRRNTPVEVRKISVNGVFNIENIKFLDAEVQSKKIEIVNDKGNVENHWTILNTRDYMSIKN